MGIEVPLLFVTITTFWTVVVHFLLHRTSTGIDDHLGVAAFLDCQHSVRHTTLVVMMNRKPGFGRYTDHSRLKGRDQLKQITEQRVQTAHEINKYVLTCCNRANGLADSIE